MNYFIILTRNYSAFAIAALLLMLNTKLYADQPVLMISPPALPVNPQETVTLIGSSIPATGVTYKWSIVSGDLPLDGTTLLSSDTSATLIIRANVLVPGNTYGFRLTGYDEHPDSGYAEVMISVNTVPTGGTFSVSPDSGITQQTTFTLSADNWTDNGGNLPLTYTYSYRNNDEDEIILLENSLSNTYMATFPGGTAPEYNVRICVKITNSAGIYTEDSSEVIVLAPAFQLSTANLAYGNVLLDETKQKSVTVTNTGATTLNITSINVSNAQFSILPTDAIIEAGNEQEFTVTFAPTTDGNKTCVFEFIHNGITSPDTVTATGTGALIGSISGTVFNDSNGNGQKDVAEAALQNWKIKISGTTSDETIVNDSLLSDVNGNFSFDSLVDGNYTLNEVAQSGWFQTVPTNPSTYLVIFSGGTDVNEKDFGNIQLSNISGNVFSDANDNSTKDDGEAGISNWKIRLTGTSTDSVSTDGSGNYSFTNLFPGTYSVAEDTQSGYVRTVPAFPGTYTIAFEYGGQNITGNNFGNLLDTMKYRTFKPTDGLSSKPVKIRFNNKTNKIVTTPNEATALQAVFTKIGKAGMTFLGVPQTAKDSIKKYAWVFYKRGAEPNRGGDAISNVFTSPHTGDAYPLDSLRKSGKKSRKLKGIVKADFKNYNNKAIEQGVLLRLNIRASADTVLPLGFGDLIITKTDTCFGRPIYGMTVTQLATLFDSVMTYYTRYGVPDSLLGYSKLATFVDSIIRPLNETFVQDMDSSNYAIDTAGVKTGKNGYDIVLKGYKTARTVAIGVKNGKTITGSSGEVPFTNAEPTAFELYQNYPNPFNPQTAIGFSLLAVGNVSLKVYNVLGQEVAILINNETLEEGAHEIQFDASTFSSGVYFYRIAVSSTDEMHRQLNYSAVKRMIVIK